MFTILNKLERIINASETIIKAGKEGREETGEEIKEIKRPVINVPNMPSTE